jgi:hypothetical protein
MATSKGVELGAAQSYVNFLWFSCRRHPPDVEERRERSKIEPKWREEVISDPGAFREREAQE